MYLDSQLKQYFIRLLPSLETVGMKYTIVLFYMDKLC